MREVTLASVRIYARVTRLSADRLGLAPGMPIYALIKAVSLDRSSTGWA